MKCGPLENAAFASGGSSMTDPQSLLLAHLERPDVPISRQAILFWPDGLFHSLLALGLLREVERGTRVTCPECFSHEEEVIASPARGGVPAYAIPCPVVLRAEVSLEDLRQWRLDALAVATMLATSLQLGGVVSELATGRLWRLGRWKYRGQSREILLGVGFSRPAACELRRRITGARRPIVFVPLEAPAQDYWVGKPPPVIRLAEVISFGAGGPTIDAAEIVELVHESDEAASASSETFSLMLDRKVRSALENQLTHEVIVQSYLANGSSARKAADDLNARGHAIHHATISRIVKKYEEVISRGSRN